MGIAVLGCALLLFKRRIKDETAYNQLMLCGMLFLYCLFSLFLNWYLGDVYGWEYGIPGSDLRMYYDGAVALNQGASFSQLAKISDSFELSLTHLGYIAYVIFIAITALTPVIFTIKISLQILYCVQCIAAITATLNIADFFCSNYHIRNRVLWMLVLCASVFQMPCLLMRDIWIFFFISKLMRECKEGQGPCSQVKCWLYIFVCFVTRYYTLAITLPIYVAYKLERKKEAIIGSFAVFAAFFLGQTYISRIAQIVGIKWAFDFHFDLISIVSFILFPSPFSQAHNIQHLNLSYHAIFGGNTEWIYYLLSCWNLYVIPLSVYGATKCLKQKKIADLALWGMIILNIAMLMCLFYGGTSSPRHKLLIVISLAFLYKEGIEKMDVLKRALYFWAISLLIIGILFVTY